MVRTHGQGRTGRGRGGCALACARAVRPGCAVRGRLSRVRTGWCVRSGLACMVGVGVGPWSGFVVGVRTPVVGPVRPGLGVRGWWCVEGGGARPPRRSSCAPPPRQFPRRHPEARCVVSCRSCYPARAGLLQAVARVLTGGTGGPGHALLGILHRPPDRRARPGPEDVGQLCGEHGNALEEAGRVRFGGGCAQRADPLVHPVMRISEIGQACSPPHSVRDSNRVGRFSGQCTVGCDVLSAAPLGVSSARGDW
jgi:hypothetical protein